ncbi:hypothetical protein Tsubulata_032681 [Turnera subulata]|uniref:Timeless N-terminal domain-containing protein n=1 Tax=Turnera subulata TaxID=218843 RepID=A0A9Q0JJU7_9ROSI|nr:hypothetical protein Tsubulata_032681 [Turnera subulata]
METQGLAAICAGLGVAEEDEDGNRIGYTKDDSCHENLKDLLRFMRRDDPHTRQVFKQVCKWNTVSKDLIPLIKYYQDDRNLVLNAVKVLVFLTMPIEPSSTDIPEQIEYLWGLKSAITYSDTVAVIVSLLEGPLENLERDLITEDDWKLVQLVLTLFRNILAIQDISPVQKAGGSAIQLLSLRDKFLELLFNENVMDLIILVTQHVDGSCRYFRQDNLLLLEIFHYIFMGQDPELIAKAKQSKACGDTKDYLRGLESIMKEEEERKKLSRSKNLIRHSQFSGTFTRVTMDGSKAVYKGNPNQNNLLKPHATQRGPNKRILWDNCRLPTTKNNILELLHDFLTQFLSGGYNVLMQSIQEDIDKEHAIQNSDIVVFFQVAQFAISFQYHKFLTSKPTMEKGSSQVLADEDGDSTLFKGDMCGPIAATMQESMFILVISRWRYAFEGLKETNNYKFLSAAGSLMKIMIRMLDLVLKLLPENSKEPQTTRILLYKLFYDQTDQGMTQFILSLIKSFDTHKQTKSDLADLIETVHIIVRLMEHLQARGTLRVSRKSRKSRKKKSPADDIQTGHGQSEGEAIERDETAVSNTEQLTDPLMKRTNVTSDDQTTISVAADSDERVITLPETGDIDRPQTIEEGIEPNIKAAAQVDESVKSVPEKERMGQIDDDLCCSSDDSSSDEQPAATYEVDFKVSTFISAFANHNIIQNLCWLLKFYKNNPVNTNHYIVRMLQRITDDLDLSPMLYQLSLLTTFYEILEEQKQLPCVEYKNIVDFLTRLVRRMLKKMKTQPLLFVEVLFWKSRRECHYINAEYLLHELGHMRKETASWGKVSENGETGSSQAKGWVPRSLADALGEDEADVVISQEPGYQNAEDTLEHENDGLSKRKRRLIFTDEMETRIKDLYEKFKGERNCSRLIAESLQPEVQVSPAQVFNKLKQLGLKVVSKKRIRLDDRPTSASPEYPEDEGKILDKEIDGHDSTDLGGSLLRQPLNIRKRVRAFSKDQEATIKVLFEQFKDHKRCNYMIANALAADDSFTAAQVSRKLKQMGLRVPQKKRSKADSHLGDEELKGFVPGGQDSDDETLLSLRNRSKKKDDSRLVGEPSGENIEGMSLGESDDELLSSIIKSKKKDDSRLVVEPSGENIEGMSLGESDDELLSSILKHKKKDDGIFSGEQQNNVGEFSDDSSDELLSSKLKKTRKRLPKAKDEKLATIATADSKTADEAPYAERDGVSYPIMMDVDGIDKNNVSKHANENGNSKAEETGSIPRNSAGVSPSKSRGDVSLQQADDELADLEDDDTSDTLVKSSALRRKLRMVIDGDDDD